MRSRGWDTASPARGITAALGWRPPARPSHREALNGTPEPRQGRSIIPVRGGHGGEGNAPRPLQPLTFPSAPHLPSALTSPQLLTFSHPLPSPQPLTFPSLSPSPSPQPFTFPPTPHPQPPHHGYQPHAPSASDPARLPGHSGVTGHSVCPSVPPCSGAHAVPGPPPREAQAPPLAPAVPVGSARDGHVKHKYFPANVSGKLLLEMRVEGGRGTPDPWGTKVPWPCAWSRGRGQGHAPGFGSLGGTGTPHSTPLPPSVKIPMQEHVNKVIFILKKSTLREKNKQTIYTARPQTV